MDAESKKQLIDVILAELMGEKEFQQQWAEDTIRKVSLKDGDSDTEKLVHQSPIKEILFPQKSFDELLQVLDIAIESFLTNSQMALNYFDYERNGDAAVIFAAKVLMDQLLSKLQYDQAKLEIVIRRVRRLVSLFTKRISGCFQVENIAFFGHSIVLLLERIEEYCEKHSVTHDMTQFSDIRNVFLQIIVIPLKESLIRQSKSKPIKKITKKVCETKSLPMDRSKKEYLLPYEKLFTSAKVKNQPTNLKIQNKVINEALANRFPHKSQNHLPFSNPHVSYSEMEEIKKRWHPLISNQNLFKASLKNDKLGQAALKMSSQITDKLMKTINR
uniref:HDAg domain-containing protein n=1 Tax=Rhabditophanes sp. KR3021 TaxID=114890 RepID=A0AC35TLT9_9BILA